MAIKKKNVVESNSKTVRSMNRLKEESFKASADMNRIISLCGGEWAYVLDPRDGKTHHVKVGSENWILLMTDLSLTEHASSMQSELETLGWV